MFSASTWPFGNAVCKLMHYLVNVTAYVTVYTLVLISVIRYMTIVHSVATAPYRTKNRVVAMIVGIWAVMLAVNVPIPLSYGVVDEIEGCTEYGPEVGKRIFATFFAFAYVLPLAVIAVFSVCILRHIQQQRTTSMVVQQQRQRLQPTTQRATTRSAGRKQQAGRLLILVVVIFAVLWLPVHIHLLVAFFGSRTNSQVYLAVSILWNCLAYFNSCVNPIIYNRTSKEFRDAFRAAVCCRAAATGSDLDADGETRRKSHRTATGAGLAVTGAAAVATAAAVAGVGEENVAIICGGDDALDDMPMMCEQVAQEGVQKETQLV